MGKTASAPGLGEIDNGLFVSKFLCKANRVTSRRSPGIKGFLSPNCGVQAGTPGLERAAGW